MTEIDNGNNNHNQGLIIQETVSTRAIEALMSNYRDPQQAFLELIDNAVDNRIDGKPLTVRVRISKNELSVYNQGGRGLDFKGLEEFFVWGYSQKGDRQIGFYGVGGKAAMGYLGRSMEVVCSAQGSDVEYRVLDESWESREEGEWKQYTPEQRKTTTPDGYFRARVSNLKREVSSPALIVKLADIYRPLLLDGSVQIRVNNQQVLPLQIRYVEDDPDLRPQTAQLGTRFGEPVLVKVGVLEEGQRIKPGIRCYYNGRLITDEQFFGHPNPTLMPQMTRFIGEAHLNFVPVTTNKNSFDVGSSQWSAASRSMTMFLVPWVEKIARLKIEQKSPIESFEKDLARQAKRILEHVFATTGLIGKRDLPGGESIGRRPPTPTGSPRQRQGSGEGPGPKEGQTAPTLDATIGEIKRWGAMLAWEIISLGSSGKRSDVILENGRQILKLNSDYPLYQAAKKAGDGALGIYMAETGIATICEIVTRGKSIGEYLELLDSLTRECGAVYQTRIKEQRPARGSIHFNPR